jgi:hypothetical protein
MGTEIEKFAKYSIRYQVVLARHVASICNIPIYVFDCTGYFSAGCKAEVIDQVNTVSKEKRRAVLSVAVQQSFDDGKSFMSFVNDDKIHSDDIGLYVIAGDQVGSVDDLKDIAEAMEKLGSAM